MGPSLFPSSIAAYEHQHPCSTDEKGEEEDDEFEFRPLLPQPRRVSGRAERRPRTRRSSHLDAHHVCNQKKQVTNKPPSSQVQLTRRAHLLNIAAPALAKTEQAPPPLPPRRVMRWHHMAFGSVRVPSAMDMGEIRRRLKARQALAGSNDPTADAWAPWRLIRSLSCKGVEAVAVAAVAAPVRLV